MSTENALRDYIRHEVNQYANSCLKNTDYIKHCDWVTLALGGLYAIFALIIVWMWAYSPTGTIVTMLVKIGVTLALSLFSIFFFYKLAAKSGE